KQSTRGNLAHDFEKRLTSSIITDPASDSDKKATLKIFKQLTPLSREAMHHTSDRTGSVEDGAETRVRLPLVEENWHLVGLCQTKLRLKDQFLNVPR
ncbi:MAG: hypothetical protein ACI9KE_001025, partial [Polyangiales bacterium]